MYELITWKYLKNKFRRWRNVTGCYTNQNWKATSRRNLFYFDLKVIVSISFWEEKIKNNYNKH